MKRLKPIYIYLIAIALFIVANVFDDIAVVYYPITALGVLCFIWAIVKYFRK